MTHVSSRWIKSGCHLSAGFWAHHVSGPQFPYPSDIAYKLSVVSLLLSWEQGRHGCCVAGSSTKDLCPSILERPFCLHWCCREEDLTYSTSHAQTGGSLRPPSRQMLSLLFCRLWTEGTEGPRALSQSSCSAWALLLLRVRQTALCLPGGWRPVCHRTFRSFYSLEASGHKPASHLQVSSREQHCPNCASAQQRHQNLALCTSSRSGRLLGTC